MKKLLSLLLFSLITSCNDGNLTAVSLDFPQSSVKSCNLNDKNKFYLYNIADKRVLILKIDEANFTKQINNAAPIIISGNNQVFYREYAQTVDANSICSSTGILTTSNPTVKDWTATGGQIIITTSVNYAVNETTEASTISEYNYKITLNNIAFNTGSGEQRNNVLEFGTYKLSATQMINFGEISLKKCSDNLYYNYSGNQSITLTLNDNSKGIFSTLPADLSVPKTANIDINTNKIIFNIFKFTTPTVLDNNYFCANPLPTNIPIDEEWTATSGQVEVTSQSFGTKFKQVVKFKNVVLKNKDGLEMKLGKDYLYGEYITP